MGKEVKIEKIEEYFIVDFDFGYPHGVKRKILKSIEELNEGLKFYFEG